MTAHWTLAIHRDRHGNGWVVRYTDSNGVREHYCRWYWEARREYNRMFRRAR